MAGDKERDQMMQNLFGDQSEEEEEDDDDEVVEVVSAGKSNNNIHYQSEEGEGEGENDGEGEGESEGQGEVEEESEGEAHDAEHEHEQEESDREKVQSSPDREPGGHRMGTESKDVDSEDEGYGQRMVTSRRREVVASESEGSEDNYYADRDHEDEDNKQPVKTRQLEGGRDNEVVRDVFGDSDEDEPAAYAARNDNEQDSHRSPMEDEGHYGQDLRPEDIVPDDDVQFESEDENLEQKPKEKPVGPPLDLVVPLQQPPGSPSRMNVIKVSNIMGIEPKPFDPKTYVEEDDFVTDESGSKKRIRLEDNIVRWRTVKNPNGTTSVESNARIVKWKDGSMQLLIGNEVLDISVHESNHDHAHLFRRNGNGILQSQGRLLKKMRFMPSSLSSKSHRLLTALVDSRNKKVQKVKNCVTEIDPEREKEERERVESQTIKAHELLQRRREKVNRKYTQTVTKRSRQLSPGYLEDALDEDNEPEDYHTSRRGRSLFLDDLEAEAQAEKRIANAKKAHVSKNVARRPSFPPARPPRHQVDEYSESEREESEYETDGEDIEKSPDGREEDDLNNEDEYEEDEAEEPAGAGSMSDEEIEEPRSKGKETGGSQRRKEIDSDEESPPRKQSVNRRKTVVFDSDED